MNYQNYLYFTNELGKNVNKKLGVKYFDKGV